MNRACVRRPAGRILGASLAGLLLLSACGGGSGDDAAAQAGQVESTTTSTVAVTKAAFLAEADKLCAAADEQTMKELQSLSEAGLDSDGGAVSEALLAMISRTTETIGAVRALPKPSGEEQTISDLMKRSEAALAELRNEVEDPDSALAVYNSSDDPFAEAHAALEQYGFTTCAGVEPETTSPSEPEPEPEPEPESASAAVPTAKVKAASQVTRLAAALASDDCGLRSEVLLSMSQSTAPTLAEFPTAEDCKIDFSYLEGFVPDGETREFGTAAVTEGVASDGSDAALIWMLDVDGAFKPVSLVSKLVLPAFTGESANPEEVYEQPVMEWLRAVVAGDCAEDFRLHAGDSAELIGFADQAAWCKDYGTNDPQSFYGLIQAGHRPQLTDLGHTKDFGFYGVAVGDGFWTVMIKSTPARGHAIHGVYDRRIARLA